MMGTVDDATKGQSISIKTRDLLPIWDDVTYDYSSREGGDRIMKCRLDSPCIGVDVMADPVNGLTVRRGKSMKHTCSHKLTFTSPCYIPKRVSEYALSEVLKTDIDLKLFNQLQISLEKSKRRSNWSKSKVQICEQFLKDPKSVPKASLPSFLRKHRSYIRVPPWETDDRHLGNCLAIVESDQRLLLHVGGRKQNKIMLTTLGTQWNDSSDSQQLKPKVVRSYKDGGSVLSITTQRIHNTVHLAVRQANHCHLLKLVSKNKTKTLDSLTSSHKITDVSVSPFISGEYLYATEARRIIFRNEDINIHILNLPAEESTKPKISPWIGCHFGAHPRSVTATNRNQIFLYDLRKSCQRFVSLLTIPSPFMYHEESLHATVNHPTNPFLFFVTSSCSLLLLDERFHNHPVLKWNHMLKQPPVLLNVIDSPNETDHLVTIGSRRSQDVAIAHMDSTEISTNCAMTFLSRPMDLVDVLSENEIFNFGKNLRRLSMPMVGVGGFHVQDELSSAVVLQLTVANDIFAQRVGVLDSGEPMVTHRVGPGYQSDNFDKEELNELQQWVDRCTLRERWITKMKKCQRPKPNVDGTDFVKALVTNDNSAMFDTNADDFQELCSVYEKGEPEDWLFESNTEIDQLRKFGLEVQDVHKYNNKVSNDIHALWAEDDIAIKLEWSD